MAKTGEPSPDEGNQRRALKDLLRWSREQRGLSQQELAALVEPPLSPETVSNLERGRTRPYRHTLESVCLALGLTESQAQEVWTAWRTVRGAGDGSLPDAASRRKADQGQSRTTGGATSLGGRASELATADVVLPTTGTVTFLFTDVEASTRAWLREARAMSTAMARHDELIERVVATHGGQVVRPRGEGDSRFAVFARASDAVMAACVAQLALVQQDWPLYEPLRVRMAIHTGEAELRAGDYYGPAVNHCARLRAVAHGGQVLVSAVTAELVREALEQEVHLRDLGMHQLKDLAHSERIWQVVHPDLPAEFPPLKSMETRPHNLPAQLTSFIGREVELAEIQRLLGNTRLLTVTGPGGIGKTRLAMQAATQQIDAYPDGVWLVELAGLTVSALLAQAVATALGIREEPGGPPLEHVAEVLRYRHMLVVLDNCEQLVAECAALVHHLLGRCAGLRVLATSREPLGLTGERVHRLTSMAHTDAMHLFVERATAHGPFTLTEQTVAAVDEVCRRLDGLPLAIELAAARVTALSVVEIAARLHDQFRLLVRSSRAAPPRHRTLLAALDWSYGLLSEAERRLFDGLCAFAGGCSLEAAKAVCTGYGLAEDEILDLLAQLVEKSLVLAEPTPSGSTRYRLLESLRAFGLEHLADQGELERLQARHAAFCVDLAEQAAPALVGPDQASWLDRLEREHDNLRAALAWSLEQPPDAGPALRLAGALFRFWRAHGHLAEGRTWLARALDRDARLGSASSPATKQARLRALQGSGVLARQQGDYHAGEALFVASLALARELKDVVATADSLYWLGSTLFRLGDDQRARALAEESLALWRQLGNPGGAVRRPLEILANLAMVSGDYEQAIALHEERLRYAREAADTLGVARIHCYLGMLAGEQGQYERATRLLEASYRTSEELDSPEGVARALASLAWVARAQGDAARAKQQFSQSLALFHKLGATWGIAECLAGLARLATDGAQFDMAARLFGTAAMLRETHSIRLGSDQMAERAAGARAVTEQRDLETVRAALGTHRFEALWQAGRELTVDDAVTLAGAIQTHGAHRS